MATRSTASDALASSHAPRRSPQQNANSLGSQPIRRSMSWPAARLLGVEFVSASHRRLLSCVWLCLLTGCTGTTEPASLSGTWTGWVTASATTGTLTFTMVERSGGLSGTWATSAPGAPGNNGSLTATIGDRSGISGRLTPSDPNSCPFDFTGTLESDRTVINGTYATGNCSTLASNGTFSIVKQ
jgi:hypothetical protein